MRSSLLSRCLARSALAVLIVSLGLASLSAPRLASADPATLVHTESGRLSVETPFLHLEINLQQPALDVLRAAPDGGGRFGSNIGTIVEEVQANGRRLRAATSDATGARALWARLERGVRVTVEDIDVGEFASVNWSLLIPDDQPSFTLERTVLLRLPQAESEGLAVVSPLVPDGTDPASLARLLAGRAYRPEVGPPVLQMDGAALGLLAVDNPELTFTATTSQPGRVVARTEGSTVTLAIAHPLAAPRPGTRLSERIEFRLGWDNAFLRAHSDFAPQVESRLLGAGYFGNAVVSPTLGPVLSASMRDYRGSVWSRDTDYALQGYSYVLDDLSVFQNTLQKFLDRVDAQGVAPEYVLLDGRYGNRQSWDSMPNVIQATYTYVAKTGDLDFYRRNQTAVRRAAEWIRALDLDNDGLPDRDIFPYGYTDTVENGPLHTYAIAKFYAAFLALADLEEAIGRDGQSWREYAARTRERFAQPLDEGGYWNPATGYPIAWKRASGEVVSEFETFGVYEAIRVGLLRNPDQLASVAAWLSANRDAFMNSNAYPERLIIGGYDLRIKKSEVPMDKLWILDCNAPWITGLGVPARVKLGLLQDARQMLELYRTSADRRTPHAEFGAGPLARYGPGETDDGGRLWDNWSWFSAVYGTHFGLNMTLHALEIAPAPLDDAAGRHLWGVSYQGAHLAMDLLEDGYRVVLDAPRRLVLYPPYGYTAIEINGDGDLQPRRELTAQPGVSYVIRAHR